MAETKTRMEIEGTPYSFKTSHPPVLEELSYRVLEMRKAGRLTPEILADLRKFFRIKNIYHSNAIEGNALNMEETKQVVELGLAITGRSLVDQAEAKNLNAALDFVEELAIPPAKPITETDIKQLHQLVLRGLDDENAGSYRTKAVEIGGSEYKPPAPESVRAEMELFGRWMSSVSLEDNGHGRMEAILCAAAAHTWFVTIHPFIDGNGRVGRLLMDLILMRYGCPPAIITKEGRFGYYAALEDSQGTDLSSFIAVVVKCINASLEEYEEATQEQREQQEWAANYASRTEHSELMRTENEYEMWRSAMTLLCGHFRRSVELISASAKVGRYFFRDFGELQYEKYLRLRAGESAKKTWFFRVDFIIGEKTARYLFFFGFTTSGLMQNAEVTLHLSREEPMGSFHYEKLEHLTAPNVPRIVEIGYLPEKEKFIYRGKLGRGKTDKIEKICELFFDEVRSLHFRA